MFRSNIFSDMLGLKKCAADFLDAFLIDVGPISCGHRHGAVPSTIPFCKVENALHICIFCDDFELHCRTIVVGTGVHLKDEMRNRMGKERLNMSVETVKCR
jgi:hypothetical protein